jgi:2-dehydro-3-deoxyphosphogluconate aldolase/(4S)-4-hydroxy-2-oxoglutarate aldolase
VDQVLERLTELQLLPVVTIDQADRAEPLARALLEGGLPCLEVTLRTAAGEQALRRIAELGEDLLVGAGTVLDVEQVERAVAAGARFVVSPGLDEEVVRAAQERGVPVLPGVATATEVMRARRLGLEAVKLFPAEALGGIPLLESLAAPFPDMRFVPTGGVNGQNLASWLAQPQVPFCGGSWIAPREALEQQDFAGIRTRVEQVVDLLRAR